MGTRNPRLVQDLITGFVQPEWLNSIDFDTLEPYKASFATDDLRQRHDDCIWRLKFPRSHRSSVGMHTDLTSAAKVWIPTEDRGNQKNQKTRNPCETARCPRPKPLALKRLIKNL